MTDGLVVDFTQSRERWSFSSFNTQIVEGRGTQFSTEVSRN